MGNNGNNKRKKKGRPSLLDIQKRNLRPQNPNPNPKSNPNSNPYRRPLRTPTTASRRAARRNHDADDAVDDDEEPEDEEDEDLDGRRRREKKMRLVMRLPSNTGEDSAGSASDSEAVAKTEVRSDGKTERQNSASKATDAATQEPSDSGPTTPLPDKKLLVFILDRLQKKDTYGVFSEPVDPEELPDYHEIIKHPMDFGTIRQKLSDGAYATLEQFEKDVYLICSNAMQYNAPDTVYFRQARAIQEKAKKDFDNLRQESDDNEKEPKPARRGRPPMKNVLKKLAKTEHAGSDFSLNANLDNAEDNSLSNLAHNLPQKGLDKSSFSEVGARPYALRNTETPSFTAEYRLERYEEYSGAAAKTVSTRHVKVPTFTADYRQERHEEYLGSATKGFSARYGKKFSVPDENRRSTYKQLEFSSSTYRQPVLMAMDGERKQLVPVGLHIEHAYARSLARFAANLGPSGWDAAAKLIERVVPPGTKFGRGWVVENDVPQQSRSTLIMSTSLPSTSEALPCTTRVSAAEQSLNNSTDREALASTGLYVASSLPAPNRSVDSVDGTEYAQIAEQSNAGSSRHVMWPNAPFQLQQNQSMQPTLNGFTNQISTKQPSLSGKTVMTSMPIESISTEAMMTHSRALDMVSRNNIFIGHPVMGHLNTDMANSETDPRLPSSSGSQLHDSNHDSHGPWQSLPSSSKQSTVPPDLNVGFQSPGSPVPGVLVDSQHPDLALQL